jgi:pimeloyl-ACP methyl ester carboxylesterase
LPVVYIHGIGIGLFPYVDLLQEFAAIEPDVGIIAVEIMPISARITTPQLLTEDLRTDFSKILDYHGWTSFVLASNSYGTFITTQIFHSPDIRPRIAKMLLIDPVSFLLHLPDVAYNVTARTPHKRTEWTLWYFSAKDMYVSHTLHRRSFWTESIMWKEDLKDIDVTVCLAGNDIIVNSDAVGRYLFGDENDELGTWKERLWTGKGLDLVWFAEGDHADVFDHQWMRERLVNVMVKYVEADNVNNVGFLDVIH